MSIYLALTLLAILLVVLALVGYLTATALLLLRARNSVAAIADGLEAVQAHTEPVPEKLTAINEALGTLLAGLQGADGQLGRAAKVFRL